MSRLLLTVLALFAVLLVLYVMLSSLTETEQNVVPIWEPAVIDDPLPLEDPDAFPEGDEEVPEPKAWASAWLDGRVVRDDDGAPVADVLVQVWRGKWKGTAKTAADGGFEIGTVPSGKLRIRTLSRDLIDPEVRVEAFEPDQRRTIEIRLKAGATIFGIVTDRESGTSLKGITVSLSGAARKAVATDPRGEYRLSGLPAGVAFITAESSEYPLERVSLTISDESEVTRRDISLRRGATVGGLVLDTSGAPVSGAEVSLAFQRGKQTLTAKDGRFTLTGLPVDRLVRLVAKAEGYVPGRSGDLRMKTGEVFEDVELVLSQGGRVTGRVLNADGKPAAGATVRLVPTTPGVGLASVPTAVSGPDGRFEVAPVAPGDHKATARLAGTLGGTAEVRGVVEGASVEDIVIRLKAAESITGIVVDTAGEPVAGAVVSARPAQPIPGGRYVSVRTGKDGTFNLLGVSVGNYHVSVRGGERWNRRGRFRSARGDQRSQARGSGARGRLGTAGAPGRSTDRQLFRAIDAGGQVDRGHVPPDRGLRRNLPHQGGDSRRVLGARRGARGLLERDALAGRRVR